MANKKFWLKKIVVTLIFPYKKVKILKKTPQKKTKNTPAGQEQINVFPV